MKLLTPFALLLLLPAAAAQWDPQNAQWGKTHPDDVRVMTWNVRDTVCSSNTKGETAFGDWHAVARIIASLKPDVLVLQETGDNSGNGTGSGVDSVTNLTTTANLLLHGGADPFKGGTVGSWVQKYAPAYDLPFIFVSTSHDSFNRNVILSRWPFADLNGDTKSQYSDFTMIADKYATSGGGGIRGYGVAEIDLPDATYAGDLVVGNSHLKAGSDSSDHDDRVLAAARMAYFIDHLYNGAGTGTPDPNAKIIDSPAATSVLDAATPVITAGDWNENEATNGTKGPAEWITVAAAIGGTDGTDRDQSDMTYDAASDWYNGSTNTIGSTKLDYIGWQDSIATLRRAVVFNSATIPAGDAPPELAGYTTSYTLATSSASDHRAVFADFILPAAECNDALDLGQGKAGTGGLVPRFTVCGTLGTGQTADFLLEDAKPLAGAAAVIGFSQINAPYAGGVLVPAPDVLLFGFAADASGTISLPGVPGGGGPFDVWMQWVVFDAGATSGKAFSNGLRISWLP